MTDERDDDLALVCEWRRTLLQMVIAPPPPPRPSIPLSHLLGEVPRD